jgi:hypothetical protein
MDEPVDKSAKGKALNEKRIFTKSPNLPTAVVYTDICMRFPDRKG